MRMIKQGVFTLLVVMTAAIVAGCTAGANPAVTSAGQQQTQPQTATPYSQPLMATGGDLVMLRVRPPGIAG